MTGILIASETVTVVYKILIMVMIAATWVYALPTLTLLLNGNL